MSFVVSVSVTPKPYLVSSYARGSPDQIYGRGAPHMKKVPHLWVPAPINSLVLHCRATAQDATSPSRWWHNKAGVWLWRVKSFRKHKCNIINWPRSSKGSRVAVINVCNYHVVPRAQHLILIKLNCVLLSAPKGLHCQVTLCDLLVKCGCVVSVWLSVVPVVCCLSAVCKHQTSDSRFTQQ